MNKLLLCFILMGSLFSSCVKKSNKTENTERYPNVWGGKQIFAYSALEGETNFFEPFTCILLEDRLGMRIGNHDRYLSNLTEEQFINARPFWFELEVDGKRYAGLGKKAEQPFDSISCGIVASDLLSVTAYAGELALNLELVHQNRQVILGELKIHSPKDVQVKLNVHHLYHQKGEWKKNSLHYSGEAYATKLHMGEENWQLLQEGFLQAELSCLANQTQQIPFDFRISYDGSFPEATPALFAEKMSQRKENYQAVSTEWIPQEDLAETYLKAYSVMRANTCSAQGIIQYQWTTPDRTPHKKMWLWDSGFHAIGLRHFSTDWAEKAIQALLSVQREDGYIAHCYTPNYESEITQPPVLAFAVWKVYEKSGNLDFVRYCYPRLKAYLNWYYLNRDHNHNGLMEWYDGNESGMDNSPRFDSKEPFDAVDFNCFMANDWQYMQKLANVLNLEQEKDEFAKKEQLLKEKINALLWDEERQMYSDRDFNGKLTHMEAISSFLPLFANVASSEQAKALVKEYANPEKWWTALPCPSISKQDPSFGSNMWRGPVWINYCYLLYEGFKQYGYQEMAEEMGKRTTDQISYWYHQKGSIFEFFDPLGKTSPTQLPRKKALGCIHEFGWSCTLYMEMLNDLYRKK